MDLADLPIRLPVVVRAPCSARNPQEGCTKMAPRHATRPSSKRRRSAIGGLQCLEGRQLLATFAVTSLSPGGDGSLRAAIVQSNQSPGPDTINFGVTGSIRAGRNALPAITDPVSINGASAPSFAGSPLVTIDFQNTRGLTFDPGSDGSSLTSLSIVRANNAGVTLNASRITVQGNTIGVLADGRTAAGNRGDGIRINPTSRDNLIGRENPVTSITYFDADGVPTQPVSGWQGIRQGDTADSYLIAGTSNANGLLYDGPIDGVGGVSYLVNYPGAATTSVYGPDNLEDGVVRLVGSYRAGQDTVLGFLFEGTPVALGDAANYRTIAQPGAQFNYVHSTMGGLAVGNFDGPTSSGQPIGPGRAFLYDVASASFLTDIVFPGSLSNTAYGIWSNGGTSYTIAGGYAQTPVNNLDDQRRPIGEAYLVDYDSASGAFTNWKSFSYPNGPVGATFVTHFEGISSVEKGVYTLSVGSSETGSSTVEQGSVASVRRNTNGSFGEAVWVDLAYPGVNASITSDSIIGNQVVGIVLASTGGFSYQATVNTGFQLSNVISANSGDGVAIRGSSGNRVAMNNIGTDVTGTLPLGNARNGVHLYDGASDNLIGGQATGGNDPTGGVFVRPPQGNLISGNNRNGVLIDGGATRNTLSGNFVGTDASGNRSLGNRLDGVAIVDADANQLIGCTFQQDPFVFYNVLSGNGGNGLRITDSDDITVHANFLGVGANNASVVANGGNGLLVSGTSRRTQVGGVIPLGNVISGNNRHGIDLRDRASGFVSFNTFAGLFAFGSAAPNRLDGMHVSSTGGNNLIRTCIVSGNLGDGIEITGRATGVQVTETGIGTNTGLSVALPNGGSGIRISGRAHGNSIGGFQPSIEPQVTISANNRYGVEVVGAARDNSIYHTVIGDTGGRAGNPLGNRLGGILLGRGTSATTIGGDSAPLRNLIANNAGNGITILCSRSNVISDNQVTTNQGFGLYAQGICTGTIVRRNVIQGNARGNADLANSRGVVLIP